MLLSLKICLLNPVIAPDPAWTPTVFLQIDFKDLSVWKVMKSNLEFWTKTLFIEIKSVTVLVWLEMLWEYAGKAQVKESN